MRRILLVVLPVFLALGCSRQPQPHVGEWETEIYGKQEYVMRGKNYNFLENGDVQWVSIFMNQPQSVVIGKYKVDYSKDPIQIDIKWESGKSEYGIIRFIGEDKGLMEMKTSPEINERPTKFAEDSMLLTKKVKK